MARKKKSSSVVMAIMVAIAIIVFLAPIVIVSGYVYYAIIDKTRLVRTRIFGGGLAGLIVGWTMVVELGYAMDYMHVPKAYLNLFYTLIGLVGLGPGGGNFVAGESDILLWMTVAAVGGLAAGFIYHRLKK